MSTEKSHHQVRREILQKVEQDPARQAYLLGRRMGELLQEPEKNRQAIQQNITAARALGVLIDLEDLA